MGFAGPSSSGLRGLLRLTSELNVGLLSVDYLALCRLGVEADVILIVLHLSVRGIFALARLLTLAPVKRWVVVVCEEFVVGHCNF